MKKISWKALKSAEALAFKENIHIRRAVRPDGKELEILSRSKVMRLVRKRPFNSHKGTFGRLLCITGSDRFIGASEISAIAALRSGVGLVSVFTTRNCAAALAVTAKEATLIPCPSDENGTIYFDFTAEKALAASLKSADAVLIGCGLGKSESTARILEYVILNANCPVIIDADGINLVYTRIELLRKARNKIVLTPHPAELARLSGVTVSEAADERYPLAKKLSDSFGVTVVAKSCATVITGADGDFVSMFGNDGLSKGGSGDLLAGLISSFSAQGISPSDSAKLGTVVLGTACEKVSKRLSKTGMTASDILNCLPTLFKKFERA